MCKHIKKIRSSHDILLTNSFTALKPDFHLSKKLYYLVDWKPFKNDENVFYFMLKALFVTTFWLCRKNDLIRKIRLTSRFMTSQPGLQTISIGISANISQSKGNQTMQFVQLIYYNKGNMFLQKLCRKWGKDTSSRPFFIF